MAGNGACYKDWVDGRCYIVVADNESGPSNSMSYLKFTLYVMPEKHRRWEMLVGDQSKSHEVLIDKEKLSDTHHVAGQT